MASSQEKSKYKLSVILSKSGSEDDYQHVLKELQNQDGMDADDVQIIVSEEESAAQDLSSMIEGEKVIFSNGFDVWERGALIRMIDFLDSNSEVDVVLGRKIGFYKDKKKMDLSGESGVIEAGDGSAETAIDIRSAMIRRTALGSSGLSARVNTLGAAGVLVRAIDRTGRYGYVPDAFLLVKEDRLDVDLRGLTAFAEGIRADSASAHGSVSDYVYHVIAAAVNAAIRQKTYREDVENCLQTLPDSFIKDTYGAEPSEIKYTYRLKYGRDIYAYAKVDGKGRFMVNDVCVFDTRSTGKIVVKLTEFDVKHRKLTLEGFTNLTIPDDKVSIILRDADGSDYEASIIDFPVKDEYGYGDDKVFSGVRFILTVPAAVNASYEFLVRYSSSDRAYKADVRLGKFSRLNERTNSSYFVKSGHIVRYRNGRIRIEKSSAFRHLKYEVAYLKEICSQGLRNVAIFRLLYWLSKPFNSGKPIWVVVDRPHVANDNGEHFFRYLMTHDACRTVKPYFLLKKSSPDYERLRKIGPVLDYGSVRHKVKTLHASKVISASGNDLALNPFGFSKKYYQDLYEFDFVYLRHGVSHNDQSAWLNRLIKNIKVLDTTSKYERDAILSGNYLYDESRVFLTGLPRFDSLYDDSKNVIAVMPTWRKDIEGQLLPNSSQRAYIRNFKETEFYRFYNGLINDERLLKAMRESGYRGVIYMHPAFEKQAGDFESNDCFQVGKGVADYQKIFRESNLLVTDYSSVAFDFAYLKKPVVYAQFDSASFYENHVWGKGYFTYEENGFGPITKDLDETVSTLIDYIQSGCEMKSEDVAKVEDFFAFTDRNNCERVYNAIIASDGRKDE